MTLSTIEAFVSNVRVGDTVFSQAGLPRLVKDRDPISGQLTLKTEPPVVHDAMRHGYLNGLDEPTRRQLYDILDGVKGDSTDPLTRVEAMRTKVEELEQDPRNLHLTRYLRAEMVHIMNTYGIKPKEYSVHESKVR